MCQPLLPALWHRQTRCPLSQLAVEEDRTQHRPLGTTASHRPPTRPCAAHHDPLSSAVRPLPPSTSPSPSNPPFPCHRFAFPTPNAAVRRGLTIPTWTFLQRSPGSAVRADPTTDIRQRTCGARGESGAVPGRSLGKAQLQRGPAGKTAEELKTPKICSRKRHPNPYWCSSRSYLAMYSLIWATDSSNAVSSKILKQRYDISAI